MKTLIKYVVLLAIAAGLTLYHFNQREQEREQERAERLSKRVFPHGEEEDLAALRDAVAEIRLTPRGATEEIVLVRQEASPEGEAEWRITEPRAFPADSVTVSGMVSTLVGLELAAAPEDSVIADVATSELENFGLDEPGLRIGLRYRDETDVRMLRIGDQDPTQRNRYALVDGEDDVLIIQDRDTSLNRDLTALRGKSILSLETDQVIALQVDRADGEPHLRLARADTAAPWRVEIPVPDDADTGQVNSLLSQLANARVHDFLVDDPTPAQISAEGLASPEFTITVVSADGAARTTNRLLIGPERGQNRVAMVDQGSTIFTVPSTSLRLALGDPGELRNRLLAEIPTSQIERIIYQVPGQTLSVTPEAATGEAMTETHWVVADPPEGLDTEAAEEEFRTMATALASLRARTVLPDDEAQDLAALGLDPPSTRIIVETTGDAEPVVLELGNSMRREEVQGHPVRRLGRDAVLFLESWRADQLILDLADLGLSIPEDVPPLAPYIASPEVTTAPASPEQSISPEATAQEISPEELAVLAEQASPTP